MRLLDKIKSWYLHRRRRTYLVRTRIVSRMSDVPEKLDGQAYIVKRNGKDMWLVFDCPCSSGHKLVLNLSRSRYPFWQTKLKKNVLNVLPSVWVTDECHSHFFIKNNDVVWARDVTTHRPAAT